jgi:hypothetical protein
MRLLTPLNSTKKVEGGTRTNGKKSGGVDEIRVAPFKSNDSMAMVAATN